MWLTKTILVPAALYAGRFSVPVGDRVTLLEEAGRSLLAKEVARVNTLHAEEPA